MPAVGKRCYSLLLQHCLLVAATLIVGTVLLLIGLPHPFVLLATVRTGKGKREQTVPKGGRRKR